MTLTKLTQVFIIRGDGEVHVAAELGGAVQNARLTSHEERVDPMFPESRKDFANRARGQANLPTPGTWPTAFAIPQNAGPASSTTTPAFLDLLAARKENDTSASFKSYRSFVRT